MRGALAAILLGVMAGTPALADAESAQRQYRIARRLAAEGSADAASALRRVVELDPAGALADDALLEEALLDPLPRWPEGIGSIGPAAAGRALALLGRILDEHAEGDRAPEARYHRGLLLLEPLPQHDASAARIDLLTVATNAQAGIWADAARYGVAWLAEQRAEPERALAAYQRLWIDAPDGSAASRARAGLARLDLRDRRWADAARQFEAVAALEPTRRADLDPLKELAVRNLLGIAPPAGALQVIEPDTGVRTLAGFATLPAGGSVTADRRSGAVVARDRLGRVLYRWSLAEPGSLATDPLGRIYAAASDGVYRLVPQAAPTRLAALGDFAQPTDMTVDGLGGIWLLDRRGGSIGRLEPGAEAPLPLGEGGGVKLVALRWDGRRLVGLDARTHSLVVIGSDGSPREVLSEALQKPVGLAVDPSGRIAVLDVKAASVTFFDALGQRLHGIDLRAAGVGRAAAIALGNDGALHLFDESSGTWAVLR